MCQIAYFDVPTVVLRKDCQITQKSTDGLLSSKNSKIFEFSPTNLVVIDKIQELSKLQTDVGELEFIYLVDCFFKENIKSIKDWKKITSIETTDLIHELKSLALTLAVTHHDPYIEDCDSERLLMLFSICYGLESAIRTLPLLEHVVLNKDMPFFL